MKKDVNERIKDIISHYGLTERAFSIRIGVPQMTINSLFKRNSVPSYTVLNAIAECFKEVSTEWLIRGDGDMFIAREAQQLQKTPITENTSSFYERMIDKKDKRIEELVLLVGQLHQEVKTLRQDKKIAPEMDDVLNVAERLKPTGTDSL